MLERTVEKAVCSYVKKCGGKAYKWVSPGETGVPDRLCIFPGGVVVFVELKRPGVKDGRSVRQKKVQNKLIALGCNVMPHVNSLADFKQELKERFGIDEV